MKIYLAADHAGLELKNALAEHVRGLGHSVEDCGAHVFDPNDDYPSIMRLAVTRLSDDVIQERDSRAILVGGSGQGEAIVANRVRGIRCALFYGEHGSQTDSNGKTLSIMQSVRAHNDTNALAIGARFVTVDEAKKAVEEWLGTPFSKDDRHIRRIWAIDS